MKRMKINDSKQLKVEEKGWCGWLMFSLPLALLKYPFLYRAKLTK